MNSISKRIAGVALSAVIVLGMIAPSLWAGSAAMGEFNLPFNAQWERIGLQTGEYTFSVDHITMDGSVYVYRGNEAMGIVRPEAFDSSKGQSQNPELVLVRHNGKVAVRALSLPGVGTFYFSLPKDLKVLAAQQPQMIETIRVRVNGQ